jgi:hypothetical protein
LINQVRVVLDAVALRHLRPRLHLRAQAVERVEHAVAVLGGDAGGGENGIEHPEVGLRHQPQGAGAGGLANGGQRQQRHPGGLEQRATSHGDFSLSVLW